MRSGEPLTDADRDGWLDTLSQLATLKEPSDALVVDAAESPVTLVERIRAGLALGR